MGNIHVYSTYYIEDTEPSIYFVYIPYYFWFQFVIANRTVAALILDFATTLVQISIIVRDSKSIILAQSFQERSISQS